MSRRNNADLIHAAKLIHERGWCRHSYTTIDGRVDALGALHTVLTGWPIDGPESMGQVAYDRYAAARHLLACQIQARIGPSYTTHDAKGNLVVRQWGDYDDWHIVALWNDEVASNACDVEEMMRRAAWWEPIHGTVLRAA